MATVVIMPRQGQSVESCVITEWKKKVGDKVAEGDILFSYETDKSSFDETSTVAGTVLGIYAEDGDDVPCLDTVCIIGSEGEDISALIPKKEEAAPAAEVKAEAAPAAAPAEAPAPQTAPAAQTAPAGEFKISPRARILAERTDADISKAVATGPMGRIIERDVNALLDAGILKGAQTEAAPAAEVKAAAAPAAAPVAEYTDEKLPNIRKVIAKSMHASLSNMAQLTLNSSFDATALLDYRAKLKACAEELGLPNITINDMVLFAVSRTLKNHKLLNAHYLDDKEIMRFFSGVHLGVAVDTERGLMVPTVFDADKLSLAELSKNAKSVIKAAQGGTINPDLLKGASFTVTNLGSLGIESFTPVINPPQTGILGVDNITRRVKEINGENVFYPAMGLSLTFDHRALDGAPAAKFLKELCKNLENFGVLLSI